jgi:Ca2+-binding RTX toxin-like protein
MAKFVAKQPGYYVTLQGLGILSNPSGVRFDDIESDSFTAQSTTVRLEIGGHGFEKSFSGRPKAVGTVTDIKHYASGTLTYKLTDAKYPLQDLAESNDSAEHTEKIFAKDDIFKGSFGNDVLEGFKGNDTFDGKAGTDVLYGDSGKDILNGGEGSDTLDGGKGKDTYVFKSDLITGYDTIVKFQSGERFELKAKFFAGLEVGELTPEQFVIGTVAQDADDRIIYNSSNGLLSHDPDGAGGVAPVYFAKVQVGVDLSAENFLII